MISAHSSGSSCSARAVEPFTSQNRIVTIRRSPATWSASGACAAGSGAVARADPRAVPHCLQKRAGGSLRVPQLAHVSSSACPQFWQKRASAGFSNEQFGQTTVALHGAARHGGLIHEQAGETFQHCGLYMRLTKDAKTSFQSLPAIFENRSPYCAVGMG